MSPKFTAKVENCLLCSHLENRGGPIELGDGFRLTSDAAALAPGHAMFFPEAHVKSFAEMGVAGLRKAREVLEGRVIGTILPRDNFIAFEHGIGPDGSAENGCVDHAHIHLLPLDQVAQTFETVLGNVTPDLVTINGPMGLSEIAELADQEYFWLSNSDLRPHLLVPATLERQVLRKIIGTGLRRKDFRTWDDYDLDRATATTRLWRELLSGERSLGS